MRAKHLRAGGQQGAPQQQQHTGPPPEEAPGAYTDFRTLAKGLPDPPQVIILRSNAWVEWMEVSACFPFVPGDSS